MLLFFSYIQLNKIKSYLILFLMKLAYVCTERHNRLLSGLLRKGLKILDQADWGQYDAIAAEDF